MDQLWHDGAVAVMMAISDSRHWLMPLLLLCVSVILAKCIVDDVRDDLADLRHYIDESERKMERRLDEILRESWR